MKISPLSIVVFGLLTICGLSTDSHARPGGPSGAGRGPSGPSAGGVRPGAAPTAGRAQPNLGNTNVGKAVNPTLGKVGNTKAGNLPGANIIPSVDRVTPNQLQNFIRPPQMESPRDVRDLDATTKYRQPTAEQQQRARQSRATAIQSNLPAQLGAVKHDLFSPAWYANHPQAWQLAHPHADAFAATSFASAATWLGIAAAPVGYVYSDGTVVYEETPVSTDPAATAAFVQSQARSAAALAASTANYSDEDAAFLPLGVFALAPAEQSSASSVVQLTISKDAVINGTYFDLLSSAGTPLRGAIDKQTQRAAWSIGGSDQVVFETALANLTTDAAPVTVRFGTQQSQEWQLVRVKK